MYYHILSYIIIYYIYRDIAEVRSSSSAAVSTSKNWYLTVEALGQTYSDMAESGITGCLQLDQPVSENRHSRSGSIISTNDADSHTVSGDPSPNPYYSPGRKSTHRPYLPSESDNNHINNTDTTLNDFQTNSNSKYEKIVVQNESDYLLSQFLLKTTRTVSTYTFQLASLIKYSLFEPLQFLSSNQLSVAESCSVNTHLLIQHFSTQALLNKTLDSVLVDQSSSAAATATATTTATSTDMKIDSNIDSSIRTIPSNSPNNSDNDIANDIKHGYKGKALMLPHQVKIVGIFEQEWAEARKTRGTLLIHQLKSFAKSMAIQVCLNL